METPSEEETPSIPLCTICNKPQIGHNFVHAFKGPNDRGGLEKAKPEPPVGGSYAGAPVQRRSTATPSDPILRMLLIRLGVITPEQLTELENELQAAGMVTNADSKPGDGGSNSGDREAQR